MRVNAERALATMTPAEARIAAAQVRVRFRQARGGNGARTNMVPSNVERLLAIAELAIRQRRSDV